MKFRHPRGVRLALLSGHVTNVGSAWQDLHPRFHGEAMAKGCHCDQDVIGDRPEDVPTTGDNAQVVLDPAVAIRKAITTMLERNEEGDFTAAETPNLNIVASLCGFRAHKNDVLAVWTLMRAEAEALKGDDADPASAAAAAAAAADPASAAAGASA